MILAALKKLQLHKVYVPLNLISEYLRRSYPVENNVKIFTEELRRKLNCAVRVGLILKHGEDSYYLPTLRQEANALKTAFTTFWEIYKNVLIYKCPIINALIFIRDYTIFQIYVCKFVLCPLISEIFLNYF